MANARLTDSTLLDDHLDVDGSVAETAVTDQLPVQECNVEPSDQIHDTLQQVSFSNKSIFTGKFGTKKAYIHKNLYTTKF